MKKVVVIAVAILITNYLFAQDSTAEKLEELVKSYADMGQFNGSVLVSKGGRVLLEKGYGLKNAEMNTINDQDTKFQIASVTKQFTSAVILKLVELRKLSLSDKLSKYYSGFPYGDSITMEHLLTHTSGLRNFTEEDSSINETDEKRMVPYLKKLKPDFAPGTSWHYSNSGYVLLGYIIGKVSGMDYFTAVRKYIFGPAGMDNSGFDFAHLVSPDKATGYDELTDSACRSAGITDASVPFAAGAIYSTVEDMYKWHLSLQLSKIVRKDLMAKAYTACPQHNYGYGWQIDSMYGKKMVSHSGAISGFGSNFARIADDNICIVMLSNKSGSTGELMMITGKLVAILYQQPYSLPKKKTAVSVSDDILKKYTGTYFVEDMQLTIVIHLENGRLMAEPSRDGHPGPLSVMLAEDNTHFFDERESEIEITFETDNAGNTTGVSILQMGTKKYAKKIK